MLTFRERQLLEKLAAEGKPTKPEAEEIKTGRELALWTSSSSLVTRWMPSAIYAVITPKGRQALQQCAEPAKRKRPLGPNRKGRALFSHV
jgi:hypothetical protein